MDRFIQMKIGNGKMIRTDGRNSKPMSGWQLKTISIIVLSIKGVNTVTGRD